MTRNLEGSDFDEFFKAVHGYKPFVWQGDLARRVVSGGGWPEAIDVPTGMGKTAAVDIAVFALACGASLVPSERTAPTRTLFIVDRRVIVDQAYDRALKLKEALLKPDSGVVGAVSAALRPLAGENGTPLEVVRMRGGISWSWRWLKSVDQPAVVVGTVDQMGSRLLFRGYGVGEFLRPIDAALCGTDCLLILDEAHLAHALVETVVSVNRYEGMAERPILPRRRPRPVVMSATLPENATDIHRLNFDRETSLEARTRLTAVRLVVTVELTSSSRDVIADLARGMANVVADRLGEEGIDRVAVVCNTVALARAVHAHLRNDALAVDLCLLTGRCRQFERQQLAEKWGLQLAADANRFARLRPLVAVATQTIEVGADFDVDLLVTEAAPLDALVQRLGRLNRLGRRAATAVVVHCESRHATDAVYGSATDATWRWLRSATGDAPAAGAKDLAATARRATPADFGPIPLRDRLDNINMWAFTAEGPLAPVALGPTLAAWARTAPAPEPDQPVAPFLHGIDRNVPQVQVCWRAGLPESHDPTAPAAWGDEVATVPVSTGETVEVPIWEALRFLRGRPGGSNLADLEGVGDAEDDSYVFEEDQPVDAWVLRGGTVMRSRKVLEDARHGAGGLRPGDTVVVRAEEGGHDEWGWTGQRGATVVDVADLCQRAPTLRLRAGVLANTIGSASDELLGQLVAVWSGREEAGTVRTATALEVLLSSIADAELDADAPVAEKVQGIASDLRDRGVVVERRVGRMATAKVVGEDEGWFVISGPRTGSTLLDTDGDQGDTSSSAAPRRVTLDEHGLDVGEGSAAAARRLGLSSELVAAIDLGGRAHDLGKADWRFQVMLHGGDRLRAEASGEFLAKSGMDPDDRYAYSRARESAEWPRGMRHEAISANVLTQLLIENPSLSKWVDADLVLHLVTTHHGRGRPLLPPVTDPSPQTVTVALPGSSGLTATIANTALVDWQGPSRFERLGRRYGWWGLALLEATVRLTDIACSEAYGRQGQE